MVAVPLQLLVLRRWLSRLGPRTDGVEQQAIRQSGRTFEIRYRRQKVGDQQGGMILT